MNAAILSVVLLAQGASSPTSASPPAPAAAPDPPETVIVTYRAKAGKDEELARVIEKHWTTVRRLGLVTADRHLLYRGEDEPGKTFFVDIFTWKSHAAPDNAPPELEAVWAEMAPLVERRGGHPGIEHPEVKPVPIPD